ncbi:MAG: hypothetical protein JJLCMIEE_01276 [Acidimicrobiales bacterium]|nr:hypothetical protein [Acidimicrobiales bacterium]
MSTADVPEQPGSNVDEPVTVRLVDWLRQPQWTLRFLLLVIAVTFAALVFAWAFLRLEDFLSILLTSLFLSFALEPAVNRLSRGRMSRGQATAVVFLIFAVVVLVVIPLVIDLMVREGSHLRRAVPGVVDDLNRLLDRMNVDYTISTSSVTGFLNEHSVGDIAQSAVGLVSEVVSALFRLVTIILFTVIFTANGPKIRRSICSVMAPERQRMVLRVWDLSIEKTGGYFYSRGVIFLVASTVVTAGIYFVSFVPDSDPEIRGLAIIGGLFYGAWDAFIPLLGAYVGAALPLLLVLISGNVWGAVILLAAILVYKQFEDYFISPRVAANKMNVSTGVALGAVLAGSELMGITGALLALPFIAIVQAFLTTYLKRHEIVESELL